MPELVVIGSYNHDLLFQTNRLPSRGETCFAELSRAHGGKGFNQAVAANRLGADTLFIAAVGSDAFADGAAAFAQEEGLNCVWQKVAAATGVASVAVEESGENQILVAAGANRLLATEHIEQQAETLANAAAVLVQLETAAEPLAVALAACNGTRILNPAPFELKSVEQLLAHCDVITPNETEFAALCEQRLDAPLPDQWQTAPDQDIQGWCRQLGVTTVIITLGAAGVFVSTEQEGTRVPGKSVEVVDTTGAGDAFNGALAAGLVRFDNDLSQAVDLAVQAASISVTRSGAAPAMASWSELTRAR